VAVRLLRRAFQQSNVVQAVVESGQAGSQAARSRGSKDAIVWAAMRCARPVLGANDGLVSNLSLVMGVAGASARALRSC